MFLIVTIAFNVPVGEDCLVLSSQISRRYAYQSLGWKKVIFIVCLEMFQKISN